jgi:hypothetical protein
MPRQVSRSLFATMGTVSDLNEQYERLKTAQPFVRSNYGRLVEIMKTTLKSYAVMSSLNDVSFKLAEAVSEHKAEYEKAMSNSFNQLLMATAKHLAKPSQMPKPSQKVVKHHVKVMADKCKDPKLITPGHTKELIKNALATHNMDVMISKGIPRAIAVQAVGTLYDPVDGEGAADPNIWGPVV